MLVNQKTFNFKSEITDDWGGSHRVVLDLEALSTAQDWKIGVSLPDNYKIDQIYGAELAQADGKTNISGTNENKYLDKGEKTEIVFIIDKGNSSNSTSLVPQLLFADSVNNFVTKSYDKSNSALKFESQVVEDWNGGYKLELDLKANVDAKNWQVDLSLPYTIREAYGVDLIDRGNGNYTISGQHNWVNLQQGQSINPIFIVNDNGQLAISPEPKSVSWVAETVAQPVSKTENIVAKPNVDQKIINVDNDFGGNLESAIAAAKDGDVVQLGSKVYYTDGITIDKDITIDGQAGSVVDGGGTSKSIFNLTSGATGATIQDVEITNGNNGIYAYSAFNLTLQNLNLNNLGKSNTIRDGQNNTGIVLNRANGLQLLNSSIQDVGRKGVGINDTDGAIISGLSVKNINLEAQHSQSHDAAGIKFFNTNDVTVKDSYLSKINAYHIWNDTTNGTVIDNNVVEDVGTNFLIPDFNRNVNISGIYNEKSPNSIIKNNNITSVDRFLALNATEFSTETAILEGNNFSSFELNTRDYWVNESVEKLIALTENPDAANFSLFADEYYAQANIG
ncbi:MAG: hypothetical protein ACFCU7_11290 [Pleurocapsa sp.]